MRLFFSFLFWLYATTLTGHALGAPVAQYQLFEDKSALLSVTDAADQTFTSVDRSLLAKGWTNSVFWVKLNFETTQNTHPLFLTVVPANFSDIKVYVFINGYWSEIANTNPLTNLNTLISKTNSFLLPANYASGELLVRLTAPKNLLAQFWFNDEAYLIKRAITLSQELVFYLGLVFFLSFYFLWNGIIKRNLFFLFTVLFSLQIALFRIIVAGFETPISIISTNTMSNFLAVISLPLTFSIYFYSLVKNQKIESRIKLFSLINIFIWIFFLCMYIFESNNKILLFSPYASAFSFSLLLIYPFIPSVRKKVGVMLFLSMVCLGLMLFIYRLFTLGFLPKNFDGLMTSGIHLPFFVLISVAGLSAIRSRQLQLQEIQKTEFTNVLNATQRHKYQEEQQRKFMLMLTHELKNGLSILRLHIQANVVQAKISYQLADQSINDMNAILDRCIEMDHIDRNEIMLNYQVCSVIDLINELIEKNSNKNRIYFSLQSPLTHLRTDRILLKTMLSNLLDNALKYSPSQSTVNITIDLEDSKKDDKVDIQNKILCFSFGNYVLHSELPNPDAIFNKYYRGPKAHRLTGSGLGLYITKSMVELMGGNVTFHEQQNYVTIKLCIPT